MYIKLRLRKVLFIHIASIAGFRSMYGGLFSQYEDKNVYCAHWCFRHSLLLQAAINLLPSVLADTFIVKVSIHVPEQTVL
jgi:hypothetical protein